MKIIEETNECFDVLVAEGELVRISGKISCFHVRIVKGENTARVLAVGEEVTLENIETKDGFWHRKSKNKAVLEKARKIDRR